MTTYHINVEGNILRVKFGKPAEGDQIVRDAAARLDELIVSGQLSGGPLLLIDGPASLPVCYLIAHKVSHLYGGIAVFDPKIGKTGKKTYITAICHNGVYKEGERIESDEPLHGNKPIKVVLCGPPHSGKSCLREGVKEAIKRIDNAPYPYMITACPDGEGAWFSKAAQRDPELARKLKQEYKAKFTPEFAQKAAGWVESASTRLNIIDVGGKMSDENRLIMAKATHAIILAGEMSKVPEWEKFCQELNLSVIAIIHSDYHSKADQILTVSPLLTGSVHYLERGEDVSTRQMVQALAELLVSLVNSPTR